MLLVVIVFFFGRTGTLCVTTIDRTRTGCGARALSVSTPGDESLSLLSAFFLVSWLWSEGSGRRVFREEDTGAGKRAFYATSFGEVPHDSAATKVCVASSRDCVGGGELSL